MRDNKDSKLVDFALPATLSDLQNAAGPQDKLTRIPKLARKSEESRREDFALLATRCELHNASGPQYKTIRILSLRDEALRIPILRYQITRILNLLMSWLLFVAFAVVAVVVLVVELG